MASKILVNSATNTSRIKGAIEKFLLICFSLLGTLAIIELVLATGQFDDLDNPKPVWIPPKYKALDRRIDSVNFEYAKRNPYGFTDKIRSMHKPAEVFRIAVLGDSFIWGDGIPYDQVWSHKLENKILTQYKNAELVSWGKNGWETIDELKFLEETGVNYNIDFLIVGFVTNDADVGNYQQKYLKWQESTFFRYTAKLFPRTIEFFSSHINILLYEKYLTDYGYDNWREKLYSEDNLKQYLSVLWSISEFCEQNSIPLLFVLTPNTPDPDFQEKYEKIIPLLEQAKINYLNLYPAVVREFKNYNPRQLWANPADSHPGTLLTEVYANEVFAYLQQNVLESTENKW
ncbi:MAG: hypothetical protein HYR94_17735 [Chloroflexi bacterium]|nr:hypothetical protein [Chloroflexota bacterium]